jgi:hypothetical protein
MSLIRVRRKRKKDWIDVRKGSGPGKLALVLLLVVGIIWYLSSRF